MLIDTIVITKNAGGGFTRLINGTITREFDSARYYTRADGVRLLNGDYTPMLSENVAPEKWTVAGNTGFTTNAEVTAALDAIGIKYSTSDLGGIITNEAAKALEYDGVNKVFTLDFAFQEGTLQVQHAGTLLNPSVYNEDGANGTVTFDDAPQPVIEGIDNELLFNYKVL